MIGEGTREVIVIFIWSLVIFSPYVVSLLRWRALGRWEKAFVVCGAALLPLFLLVNDMALMCENDEFMQLRKTPFLFIYKYMYALAPAVVSDVRAGNFEFLRYPPFFWVCFFGIDCMYISGTVFLCVKQVGNVFVRPRGL